MKTEINQSNYEKMKNSMAEVFLQYDQDNMIRKFQLEHDERYLYIRCLERPYRVSRETGQIDWSEDGFQTVNRAGYNETMTIYDVLCSSKDNCHLAGKWVSPGQPFFSDGRQPETGKQSASAFCPDFRGQNRSPFSGL